MLQRIKNKVVSKIAALIIIEIILITGSFGVLSYYQSQQSSLANTINIAGKNRYLTSNLLLQIEGYLDGTSNILQLNAAMNALQPNIMTLKQGGIISGIQLQPLPTTFYGMWNTINTKWTVFKTSIYNNLINPSHGDRIKEAAATISNSTLRQQFNQLASDLIIVSDALVLKLAEQSNKNFSEPIILQSIFVPLNIGILLLILYLIKRILKPIFVLTDAMSNVKEGNLEISVNEKGKDELSVLTRSFNLMIETIRNSVKKQKELTNKLAEANKEMKQASRLKDDFINIAAHELRNPVQPILGLAQLLRAKLRGGNDQNMIISREEQLKTLDIIIKNAKKLLLLEDNILDIARIENKSLKLNFEKFNLEELIGTVIHDTADQIDNRKITLHYNNKKDDTIFQVNADKARLSQVLSNLLSNSFKFTKNGTILINLDGSHNQKQAIVSVKDTGQGIDTEILPKLFTKFTTKSERGVGLGLFICKSIVEAHGGKIWAENNHDGKGATFYLSLPAQIKYASSLSPSSSSIDS
jgi:signal transduction histidine kinase